MIGPIDIKDFKKTLGRKKFAFIGCASFEDRCKTLATLIPIDQISEAFIFHHVEVAKVIEQNYATLRTYFGEKATGVSISVSNPLVTTDAFIAVVDKLSSSKIGTLVIDITTFTHESLLILLCLVKYRLAQTITIQLVYSTATEYSPAQDNTRKWLSKGIKQVRSVVGYPGLIFPSEKIHLIVLAGFEAERAGRLIENYEANYVSIGVGRKDQSIYPSLYELNNSYHESLCRLYQNVERFSFSLTDPTVTKVDLESQISKFPDANVIIAPLNTKLSTVGAALTAFDQPEIQLCYAEAHYYNFDSYSSPGSEFYMFMFE